MIFETRRRRIKNFETFQIFNTKIKHYLNTLLLFDNNKNCHILNFWKSQIVQYEILSRMIKNVLTIFLIDVDIERLFNMIKNVVTYWRNWLNFKIIETIMMIKYNMQITTKYFAIKINFFVVKFNEKMFVDELTFNARDFAFFKLIDDDDVLNEQKISNNDENQIRIVSDNNIEKLNFDWKISMSTINKRQRLNDDYFDEINNMQSLKNDDTFIKFEIIDFDSY